MCQRLHRSYASLALQRCGAQFWNFCCSQSLDGKTPASIYRSSPRSFPEQLPPVDYPSHFEVRKVCGNSCIKWHKRFIHVSRVLIGEWIGLDEVADGVWSVYLGPVLLAKLDEREERIFD